MDKQPGRDPLYVVEAYENSEIPDPRWLKQGEFDTPEAAVACAQGVIDRSLQQMHKPGMSSERLKSAYLSYGEVPAVFGPQRERGLFDTYAYVDRRIAELTDEPPRSSSAV